MVRWGMKNGNGANKVKHPALESVRTTVLNNDEDCLVLWGLEESDTQMCCENIAHYLIKKANGLVKVFHCVDMPRSDPYSVICKALNAESFAEFIECMPSSGVWLIFDSVDIAMCPFFDDLIHRAKQSSKFKILLVVHDVECAYHLLRARPVNQGRVAIIHPLDCCIWQEAGIRDYFAASFRMQSVRGVRGCIVGAPRLSWLHRVGSLEFYFFGVFLPPRRPWVIFLTFHN